MQICTVVRAETVVTFERCEEFARAIRGIQMAEGKIQVESIQSGLGNSSNDVGIFLVPYDLFQTESK